MRIINTVLPLVTLAVHIAGLRIPSDGGFYSKRRDLGSAKAVERRGPNAIASRSGPPDPTPGSFVPSTDKVERRSPTPNPKGGGGGGHGGHGGGGDGGGGHSHSDGEGGEGGEGGGGSHSGGRSSIASAEAAAADDAALAEKICRSHAHLGRESCKKAQQEAAKAKQEADEAQQKADKLKAKLRRRIDSWSDLD